MGVGFRMVIGNILAGFLSGIAGGLGVGGGSVLLLYLTAFAGVEQLAAQGINLFFFLPVSFTALCGHIKNRFVKWKTAAVSAAFGIPGVLFGFYIAKSIDKTMLKWAFALFLLFVGTRELFKKRR